MKLGESMEFKDVLESLMANKEVSITKMAKDTGISKSSIHGFLNGAEPQLSRLKDLAEYFGVSIDFLSTGNGHVFELAEQTLTVSVQKKQYEVIIKKIGSKVKIKQES
jgi:transcriptional regulator with XRE-family HTH domain